MVAKSFAFNDLSLPLVIFLWCHLIYSVELHFSFFARFGVFFFNADEDEMRKEPRSANYQINFSWQKFYFGCESFGERRRRRKKFYLFENKLKTIK
jgi:hypothetical protein